MESLQHLKRRIQGIENIGKITRAMELVAATKMRKSQEIALAARPYAITALGILKNLSYIQDSNIALELPLLHKRPIKRTCVVLVTSDKGLAGAFNNNVIRKFEAFLSEENSSQRTETFTYIAVGQRALQHLQKKQLPVAFSFSRIGDYTSPEETRPISKILIDGFISNSWDSVMVFSTHFRTALRQEALIRNILPIDSETLNEAVGELAPERGRFAEFFNQSTSEGKDQHVQYIIEPSPREALLQLLPYLVEMQIYHLILEANASEHAARRAAMQNASDNSKDLQETLTLEYNKSRQAGITKEIIEITSGAEALT